MTEDGEKWPYYPWYPRDFLADTLLLTETEELMYRRLLDYQWLQGAVPSDVTELAAAARLPRSRAAKAWARIEGYFPVWEDGVRRNRRLEREREVVKARKRPKNDNQPEGTWGDAPRFVYAMRRAADGAIKIGWSRNPPARAATIAKEQGCRMDLLCSVVGGPKLERRSQTELASHRIGTEWFRDTQEVMDWIAENIGAPAVHQRCTGHIPEPYPEAEPERTTTTAREAFVALVPAEYRPDVEAAIRASSRPDALVASLRMIVEGGEAVAYDHATIGQALREIAVAGRPITVNTIRAYCRNVGGRVSRETARADAETPGERVLRLAAEQDAAA